MGRQNRQKIMQDGDDKKDEPKLEDKLDKEHQESKEKTTAPKDPDKKKVEKSLYLNLTPATFHYLRIA